MVGDTKKEALLVFVLLALAYAYFFQDPGWNGNSRFGLIFAIVQEGQLTIDSFHDKEGTTTGDKSFYNGHYYSDKAIGTSVVGSIFYLPLHWLTQLLDYNLSLWPTKYLLTLFAIGLPSALAGSVMYIVCKWIVASRLWAYVATAAIALGTMYMPYSTVFFGHSLAAALLFGAFFMIFQLKYKPALYLYKNSYLFSIGLLLGFALITEYPTAVIVLLLSVYCMHVLSNKQLLHGIMDLIPLTAGGLIPVGMLLVYNALCFGNPLSIGYEHLESGLFREGMGQGLMGIHWPQPRVLYYLTVHPAYGLFWQSPVLILALIGLYFMFRTKQYRVEAVLVIGAFVVYLLINSGYYMWWGGWAFGPRHLIPMLPFLCMPLVFVPSQLSFLVVVSCLISVSQMFIPAASTVLVPDDNIRRIDELSYFEYSAIYSYCLQQLSDGQYTWNLGQRLFGLKKGMSLLPITLVILIVTSIFVGIETSSGRMILLKRSGHRGARE